MNTIRPKLLLSRSIAGLALILSLVTTSLAAVTSVTLLEEQFSNPVDGIFSPSSWVTSGNPHANNGVLMSSWSGAAGGAVAFELPKNSSVVTVSAKIKTEGANWEAIGFYDSTWASAGGLFTSGSSASLWLYVSPGGKYQVFSNGTSNPLTGENTLPAELTFNHSTVYTLSVSFNLENQKARIQISDGTNTAYMGDNLDADGWFQTSIATSSISAAGFTINGQSNAAYVDDFYVKAELSSIPEPGMAALLLGGIMALGLIALRIFRR